MIEELLVMPDEVRSIYLNPQRQHQHIPLYLGAENKSFLDYMEIPQECRSFRLRELGERFVNTLYTYAKSIPPLHERDVLLIDNSVSELSDLLNNKWCAALDDIEREFMKEYLANVPDEIKRAPYKRKADPTEEEILYNTVMLDFSTFAPELVGLNLIDSGYFRLLCRIHEEYRALVRAYPDISAGKAINKPQDKELPIERAIRKAEAHRKT